ncbi:cystathionine beta-lyase [Streptococcus bovimastitidis]|uniref:Cystathionine beta-lyase n=1 Tax=Streptococcus bovimastitidis TaxID=1856638 RepID=A0A1L8MNE2_9STRE|nr:cystathionine beta-lyase [Streptococcus bovimastitidis]OJF72246.1 cystathionine beta-lyase [Streptococcus bovimastitidis]
MTDYLALATNHGGYTTLDLNYLKESLQGLSHEQKMAFITPPPSVINAYFAEIYQKQSPQAACDYYFDLCKALDLFQKQPTFTEQKPFVRLNLSGKAYGFTYQDHQEIAIVFAEEEVKAGEGLFFELAQIFPNYLIYQEEGMVKMGKKDFNLDNPQAIELEGALLTKAFQSGQIVLLSGYNADEVFNLSQSFSGQKYYGFQQRECQVYIIEEKV